VPSNPADCSWPCESTSSSTHKPMLPGTFSCVWQQDPNVLYINSSMGKADPSVNNSDRILLTRRQWLGKVPTPLIAASLGAGLLGSKDLIAVSGTSPA